MLRFLFIVLAFLPGLLAAQSTERSASRELLDRARGALNDLQFARADSIARDLLSLALLPRPARIEALQLIAAANYPDPPGERREAFARSAISQLLQLDLGNTISRELSTPGLDSLYQSVVAGTYATSVLLRRENPITGLDGVAAMRVRANRPSAIAISMRTKDGIETFVLDSVASAVDTTLMLRVARNGQLLIKGGEYELVVSATDLGTRQTVVKSFDAVAIVPSLEYLTVPVGIDSSMLRPERARPERAATIVGGILVGAATVALGKALRAPDPVRATGESDGRYMGIGVVMTLGSIAAGWYDRGRLLDKGIASNRRALADLATRQRAARDENRRRATEYRASISVNPEPR